MIFFVRQLVVLIVFMMSLSCSAAVLEVRQDQGLPDKSISVICKDKHGLMWLGTASGLCVYDGFEFRQLFTAAAVNKGPIRQMVYSNQQDMIWVSTEKELFKIHCNTFKVETETNRMPAGNPVSALYAADNGHVYVAYRTGEVFDMKATGVGEKLFKINTEDVPKKFPFDIRMLANELMVTCAASSVQYRYATDSRRFSVAKNYVPVMPGIFENGCSIQFRTDKESRYFWVDTIVNPSLASFYNGIRRIYDIASVQFISDEVAYVFCRPCLAYKVDFKLHKIESITSDVFTGRLIKSFYKDQNNIVWLGTNKGLVKILTEPGLFKTALVQYPSVSVRSLCVDDSGNRYAGTYSGLFLLRRHDSIWRKVGDQIPFAMVNTVGRYIYFVEENFHLYRIDKNNGRIEAQFYVSENNIESSVQTNAIVADRNGILWIGTSMGLATYNADTKVLKIFKIKEFSNDNIEVRYIYVSKENHLLLCTTNGLYDLNTVTKQTVHFNTATNPALSSNTINFAGEDDKGYLWLCTETGGVNILNPAHNSMTLLNTKAGLSSNTTYDILFNKDRAWISTYNGLCTYDRETKSFYNFYAATNGLSDNEFNRNAFVDDSMSHLFYFGTINGVNSFYPDSIHIKPSPVKLFVSTISKWDNNKKAYVNLSTEDDARDITLGPSDHSLNISVALSDYTNPDRVVFSYRIKGLSDDWLTMNSQHAVLLNGLAPGTYNVEIRAVDDHGLPAANELHYTIVVTQPFFKTIWFFLLMVLVICGITSYFFFIKIKNIKQITHIRQQIASDLHDEVGSMLTRITMNSDYLKYSKKVDEETHTKLSRISALSRYAASSMNDILWTIDSRNNFSGNLADRIREHALEMLSPLSIDISFDIKVAPKESIDSETRQEVYLIFKEAINNIVKHSHATEVHIRFYYNKTALLLVLENNGLYEEDRVSSIGQGLRNIKMRALRINAIADMKVEEGLFKVEVSKHKGAFSN